MSLTGHNLNLEKQLPQSAFITIARMALHVLENEQDAKFNSRLELFSINNLDNLEIPEELMPFARLNLLGKDVPSALMQVVDANIDNLVSIGQTMFYVCLRIST